MHGLDTEQQIFFYEQEFYVFSNFSSFKLEWKGEMWMTSEHAYHSEKFEDEDILEQLRNSSSAHDSMKIAYAYKDKYRKNWDEVKLQVMKDILHAKVEQHPYVKKKLLESGDKELIENSWRDDFWGWGPNKDGNNQLGKLWMEVRDEVRSHIN
ncbi:NADAR family protein [Candidatus Kaiserbacteria bacterium]|nr:NADAR family protein [Candidatus Kaiserbacteria bacterium]